MFGELYNTVKVRYGEAGSMQSMGDWICANTKIKGKPFSFEGYPFQKAIADDMHPDLSVIKCSQMGMKVASELKEKSTAPNQLWQRDFTDFKMIGWAECS